VFDRVFAQLFNEDSISAKAECTKAKQSSPLIKKSLPAFCNL
jgi:hypothetical protein